MKENIIKDKSFSFAIQIIQLNNELVKRKEYVLSKQLIRSGTAIGALIRESEHAQSKADFINKLSIALKEANETLYWLELLVKTDFILEKDFLELSNKNEELIKLLVSIIKTSKSRR
jgi:four helix bundle protein